MATSKLAGIVTVNNPKITMALISTKLDDLSELLSGHITKDESFHTSLQVAINGVDDYPGLRGRLDRLERSNATMNRVLWVFLSALVGLVTSTIYSLIRGT